MVRDENGVYHFSGGLRNGKDIQQVLDSLSRQPEYAELVEAEGKEITTLFEKVFRHSEFTGRSGTFFAYEGLGSVYWHMVSKLLLAVQETIFRCRYEPEVSVMLERYWDIRAGLGFNKSPAAYGAFPTDPYSHTPKGQGARQPGMTGMVKEEILTRQAELGLTIEDGCLIFDPLFVDRAELLPSPGEFACPDVSGARKHFELPPGSMACSLCQTPVVLRTGDREEIRIEYADGSVKTLARHRLDEGNSLHIFQRDGVIQRLIVTFLP